MNGLYSLITLVNAISDIVQIQDQGVLQGGTVVSNGGQVVVSDLAIRLKEGGTQVVQVPAGSLSQVDWASKLKVGYLFYINVELNFVLLTMFQC